MTGTGDGVAADGLVTLREAITSANNNANVNADVVGTGAYGLDTIAFNIPRPSTDGLVSWWRGEGNANDMVGGNSAIGTIGQPQFVPARYGQGMGFTGEDGFIVADNASLDFDANTSFTIDAWVRVDSVRRTPSVLIEKRQQAGPTGYMLSMVGTDVPELEGKLSFTVQTNSAFATVNSGVSIADGAFHYVAAVVDRSTNVLTLYVDGVRQNTASTANVGDLSNTGRFFIGQNSLDILGAIGLPFNGVIDELGVFDRAISEAEIQAVAAGVRTIQPTSNLPDLTDAVVIDGYTHPGATANTDPNGFNGTLLIELNGAEAGNASGLVLSAGNSTVRGLVINRFQRQSGSFDLVGSGIVLAGGSGNTIEGNLIGTDAAGATAAGNEVFGISVVASAANTIGGTLPAARNVISANGLDGVGIRQGSDGNVIQGNFIGTQANGTGPLGNAREAVGISEGSHNTIGGTATGAGNRIAFNLRGPASAAGTVGNAFLGNSIFANGELGIDLGSDGVTPNDSGDADTGPNNLQNFPVITSVTASANQTSAQGILNSTLGGTYRIEFFSDAAPDESGFGEGRAFLGATIVADTDNDGNVGFSFAASGDYRGQFLTATATDMATGDTSEFSLAYPVTSFVVTSTADSGTGSLRQAIISANTVPNLDRTGDGIPDPDDISFDIAGAGVHTIRPTSALPDITDPVVLDGYTQPGASPNTDPNGFNGALLIELSGTNAGGADGLIITAGNSTVRGLVINGFQGTSTFAGNGITLLNADGNHIEGNFIGTDSTGTLDRGNGDDAIDIELDSNNNVIGGTNPSARNVISGNDRVAFFIATAGNVVQGNFVGTQRDGIRPLGNQQGVGFVGVGHANNNLVGGTVPGAGNVIAFNDLGGIVSGLTSGTGNSVLGNSIHSNGALGIDWAPNGPTPNDAGDADTGLNNLQNFPVITSVTSTGGSTTIQGTLNSTPATNGFRLEFFANNAADPSGFGEGQAFLGSTTVNTDASGNATFTLTAPTAVADGQFVSATATDPAGNTSEFSRAVTPTAKAGVYVSDISVIEGNSGTRVAEFLVTLLGGAAQRVTVYVATAQGTAAAGSDYYGTVQTLEFKPGGPTAQVVRTRVVGDRRVERDETYFLNVLYARGAPIVDRQGVCTIVNDDGTSHARQSIDGTSSFDPNALDWLSPWHDGTRKWPW